MAVSKVTAVWSLTVLVGETDAAWLLAGDADGFAVAAGELGKLGVRVESDEGLLVLVTAADAMAIELAELEGDINAGMLLWGLLVGGPEGKAVWLGNELADAFELAKLMTEGLEVGADVDSGEID